MQTKAENYFSEDKKSYIIHQPNKKKFWYNQLYNEDGYVAAVSNAGHGTSRYINEDAVHAIINKEEERYLYLRDENSKECWNIASFPMMEPVEELCCEHSMGYTSLSSKYKGISAEWVLFVPAKGYREVWKVSISNNDEAEHDLSIFPLVSFDLGGFEQPAYYVPFNCSETLYDDELKGIYGWNKNPHNPHKRYSAYLAASEVPYRYEGNLEQFCGIMGSVSRPECLLNGTDCTNTLTTVLGLGAVLQNKITLLPGESKTIYYTVGLSENLEDARREVKQTFENIDEEFEEVQVLTGNKYSKLKVSTPEERINNIMNYWVQKQVDFCALGKKAVRDNAQIAMAQLNFNPDQAKRTITECLCHQYKDGHAVLGWSPQLDPKLYSDPHLWLVLSCCELVKETGDTDFLYEEIPFQDQGKAAVLEHLKRAISWLVNDNGPHDLPLIHYADWNDALNIDDDEAESVFVAMGLAWALKEMSDLSEYINEKEYSRELLNYREQLIKTINEVAWDGEWYVRAFSRYGIVGSKTSETGGNIYVNPQVWSILADVVSEERLPVVLDAIDGMDTKYGIPLCKPSYSAYDRHVGRMSGMLPGLFENGGVYNHCNGFKIMSDCKAGRGKEAVRTLLKLIPDSEVNPSNISGAEPYLFVNCWCMHPSFYTRIWFAWFTGTSAWGLRGFYEGIMGLHRDYKGLRIQPCFPEEWSCAEVNREFRSCKYHIRIQKKKASEKKIYFDGKLLKSDILPVIQDGKVHEVTVEL